MMLIQALPCNPCLFDIPAKNGNNPQDGIMTMSSNPKQDISLSLSILSSLMPFFFVEFQVTSSNKRTIFINVQ